MKPIKGGMKAMTIKDIPEELLGDFKAYCALNNVKMRDCIIDFMRKCASQVKRAREELNRQQE
ncbi:hypothetical protein ES705_36338 [subsurface metagenome]